MNIPNLLKDLRLKNGQTQLELAEKLSVSQNTISQWENGKREIDYASLQELLLLSNEELTLKSKEAQERLRFISRKGDVSFYQDSDGNCFQQLDGWSTIQPISDKIKWIEIEKEQTYDIKYDLTGERGFSIWNEDSNELLADQFWELSEAVEYIYDCLPIYCHCCGEEMDGFVPCDNCSMLICPSCVKDVDNIENEAICLDCANH